MLALTLFALGWHVSCREARLKVASGGTLPFWSWEIILSIVVFAAVAGARYHTGYDHAAYLQQYIDYQKYGFFTRDYEPLFMWVTQLMAGTHVHYFFFFALWAALQLAMLYYALNRHKHIIPWVALILVLGPTFVHLMNTMRQGIVECAVPLLIVLAHDRKAVAFVLIVAALSLLHFTSIFLLFIYLIKPAKFCTVPHKTLLVIAVICIFIGHTAMWVNAVSGVMSFFAEHHLTYGNELSVNPHHFSVNIGPVRVMMLLTQLLVIFFSKYLLEAKSDVEFKSAILIWAMLYILGTSIMCNTTNFFQRPFELFTICYVIMMAMVVHELLAVKKHWAAIIILVSNATILGLILIKAWLRPDAQNLPQLYHFIPFGYVS